MQNQYITLNGQTWDMIAYEVYGDEKYTDFLMKNNPQMLDIYIFGAGQMLYTPVLTDYLPSDLPSWRV